MQQRLDKVIKGGLNGRSWKRIHKVQTLWGGYGSIDRIRVDGGGTAIVKHIRLDQVGESAQSASYQRKLKSYLNEIEWYRSFADRCDDSCRVPQFLNAAAYDDELIIVLEDLDAAGFAGRHSYMSANHLKPCVAWLANFHATFLGHRADGLWPIGTYWHLGTRQEELRQMPAGLLKDQAHEFDRQLNEAQFQTLVHGDAKPANFCFARDGRVGAVDFQYVGRGCGMKDLIYLLWGDSRRTQHQMIEFYFGQLQSALSRRDTHVDFALLHEEWLRLYTVAQDDFERFLQGWM